MRKYGIIFTLAVVLASQCRNAHASIVNIPTNNLGMIAHWTFDGADMVTNVHDSSGNGQDAYITGQISTTTVPGKLGQALSFDGVDDYVDAQKLVTLSGVTNATISAWVYDDGGSGTMAVGEYVGGNRFDFVYDMTGDTVMLAAEKSGTDVNFTFSSTAPGWHHVVMGYDGTQGTSANRLTGYLDGVQKSLGVAGIPPTSLSSGGSQPNFRIGYDGDALNSRGRIDDVRVYQRTLSPAEVLVLYNLGAARINQTKSPGSLTSGLMGHWTFDGTNMTTNVADISGQGNPGHILGQTSTTTSIGAIGQALTFDGTDDYVGDIAAGSTYSFAQNTMVFSVSIWVKISDLSVSGTLFSTSCASGDKGFNVYYSNDGGADGTHSINTFITKGTSGFPVIYAKSADNVINDNNWHHIVLTSGGPSNAISIYIDNIPQSITYVTSFSSLSSGDSTQNLTIGVCKYTAGGPGIVAFYKGALDDARIYNKTLSSSEVNQLYLQGNSKINGSKNIVGDSLDKGLVGLWSFDGADMTTNVHDSSGQNNHGYISGQVSTTTAIGKIGQAISIDGVDDFINFSSAVVPVGAKSVSAWVNTNAPGSSQTIMDTSGTATANTGITFFLTSNHIAFYGLKGTPGTENWILTGGVTIPANEWVHVAGTWDGTTNSNAVKVYVNGALDNTATAAATDPGSSSNNLRIGNLGAPSTGAFQFSGKIDDARIYNRELSAAEVKRLYTIGR